MPYSLLKVLNQHTELKDLVMIIYFHFFSAEESEKEWQRPI